MSSILPRRSRRAPSRSRRPGLRVEVVEQRIVLTAVAVHHPLVVATLGDSLTDEYTFNTSTSAATSAGLAGADLATTVTVERGSARNWVSNLAATRSAQVTFGRYSTTSQGETRNQGYSENWARSGATASGLDVAGGGTTFAEQYAGFPKRSLPGLLTQQASQTGIAPKSIDVVTILIGANDYAAALVAYDLSHGQLNAFRATRPGGGNLVNAGIEAAISTAVAKVHARIPRAKIVVITPPDLTITPKVTMDLAAANASALGARVTQSVARLGNDLARMAGRQKFGLVNTQPLVAHFRATPMIAGVPVNLQASGQTITDGFTGDGYHPGTIIQGVLAQAIVAQINALYGQDVITPLSDAEVVAYAQATQSAVTLTTQPTTAPAASETTTLTATVTPGAGNLLAPTGTVTFETIVPADGTTPAHLGSVLGVVPVDAAGGATLAVAPALVGSGSVVAAYSGDEQHAASLSDIVTLGVP